MRRGAGRGLVAGWVVLTVAGWGVAQGLGEVVSDYAVIGG